MIVVDAQNGFCHPDGVIQKRYNASEDKKRRQEKTVARIAKFLEAARKREIPVFYFCTNKSLLRTNLDWHVRIHKDLAPRKNEKVFWRDNPNDDPFSADSKLLRDMSRPENTRLLFCGFYANKCVASVAMRAVERAIPVSIVADCVYTALTGIMKIWYIKNLAGKWPQPIDIRLISFETSASYLADSHQRDSLRGS